MPFLLVPLAIGIVGAVVAASRGRRPPAALAIGVAAGVGSVLLAGGLLIAFVVVDSANRPGLDTQIVALVAATAGVVLALLSRRRAVVAAGLAVVALAGLVGLHPLGHGVELEPLRGQPRPTYPPPAGTDPRRSLAVAGGDLSLGVERMFYVNGEGGDPTHQLTARWRPPLGLVPEQRTITELCGGSDDPCPAWFVAEHGGPQREVVPQQGLALEPAADGARVRAQLSERDLPAFASVPTAWTVGLGPWQWWRALVWLAFLALAVLRYRSAARR